MTVDHATHGNVKVEQINKLIVKDIHCRAQNVEIDHISKCNVELDQSLSCVHQHDMCDDHEGDATDLWLDLDRMCRQMSIDFEYFKSWTGMKVKQ